MMIEKKTERIIPAESLFLITTGIYSDFGIEGLYRALVDIDLGTLHREYAASKRRWSDTDFLAWLTVTHSLQFEIVPYYEWWMGWSYAGQEPSLEAVNFDDAPPGTGKCESVSNPGGK